MKAISILTMLVCATAAFGQTTRPVKFIGTEAERIRDLERLVAELTAERDALRDELSRVLAAAAGGPGPAPARDRARPCRRLRTSCDSP